MIRYAITDPDTLNFDTLALDLSRFEALGATMILYRDKQTSRYRENAERFVDAARRRSFDKILLHNDADLASDLGADGVHFSSSNIGSILQGKKKGLYVVASTHSLKEAQEAQRLGADAVTLSPFYPTPGKGEPLGPEKFKSIARALEIPVIALGGIVGASEIGRALESGAAGFASIRYFAGE